MRKKTHKEFKIELETLKPNIIVLGDYVNSATKIEFGCWVCEHIWEAQPNNILQGQGCPPCGAERGAKN